VKARSLFALAGKTLDISKQMNDLSSQIRTGGSLPMPKCRCTKKDHGHEPGKCPNEGASTTDPWCGDCRDKDAADEVIQAVEEENKA